MSKAFCPDIFQLPTRGRYGTINLERFICKGDWFLKGSESRKGGGGPQPTPRLQAQGNTSRPRLSRTAKSKDFIFKVRDSLGASPSPHHTKCLHNSHLPTPCPLHTHTHTHTHTHSSHPCAHCPGSGLLSFLSARSEQAWLRRVRLWVSLEEAASKMWVYRLPRLSVCMCPRCPYVGLRAVNQIQSYSHG